MLQQISQNIQTLLNAGNRNCPLSKQEKQGDDEMTYDNHLQQILNTKLTRINAFLCGDKGVAHADCQYIFNMGHNGLDSDRDSHAGGCSLPCRYCNLHPCDRAEARSLRAQLGCHLHCVQCHLLVDDICLFSYTSGGGLGWMGGMYSLVCHTIV